MDAKPERSPRQVRVLTLPIRAASSADRGPKSAGQCLRLPLTELGAAEARLRVEGSRRRRLTHHPGEGDSGEGDWEGESSVL